MLFPRNIRFQDYVRDYYFWQSEPVKSKKVFKNILSVLYGKKKDRGHIRQRYAKKMKEYNNSMSIIKKALATKFPQFSYFMNGPYGL